MKEIKLYFLSQFCQNDTRAGILITKLEKVLIQVVSIVIKK